MAPSFIPLLKSSQTLRQQWITAYPTLPELSWEEATIARLGFWLPVLEEQFQSRISGEAGPLAAELHDPWVWTTMYYDTLSARMSRQFGIYYTPPDWCNFLVNRVLESVRSGPTPHLTRWMDPSCGTGMFLIAALKALFQIYQDQPALAREIDGPLTHHIVNHQLYGLDWDPAAVWMSRYLLAAKASELEPEAPPLQPHTLNHLMWGDGLEAQAPELAGCDQPLPHEFPGWEMVARPSLVGGTAEFQVVLGNPPFLSETRRQKELFHTLRQQSPIAEWMSPKTDLAHLFLIQGFLNLSAGGYLAMVLPEYWLHRDSGRSIREHLWNHSRFHGVWFHRHSGRGQHPWFPGASGHHSVLVALEKDEAVDGSDVPTSIRVSVGVWSVQAGIGPQVEEKLGAIAFSREQGHFWVGAQGTLDQLRKMEDRPHWHWKEGAIHQGLILPQQSLDLRQYDSLPPEIQGRYQVGEGIFLLSEAERQTLKLTLAEERLLKPYFFPSQFVAGQGFGPEKPTHWVIYTDVDTRKQVEQYPEQFPILNRRLTDLASVISSSNGPYGIHRPRHRRWFEGGPRIYTLRQTAEPAFAMVDKAAYVGEGFNIISLDRQGDDAAVDLAMVNSLLGWLNSPVCRFWLWHQKHKGTRLQVDKGALLSLPLPPLEEWQRVWLKHQGDIQAACQEWYGWSEAEWHQLLEGV